MMDLNYPALIAGLAASVGVYAHGVLGHRWLVAQLDTVEMRPTALSVRWFGDREVTRMVLDVSLHSITVVFLASAATLYLTAFGALESRDLLRFVAIVHAGFLALGLFYIEKRLDALARPLPLLFGTGMAVIATFAAVASTSV
jgi:hypothetical protein